MPYSITTRDGITIQNIPDEEPADSPRLKQRVLEIRGQMNPAPTDREKLLSSPAMRFAKGLKDPIDGLAQIARKAVDALPQNQVLKMLTGQSVADRIDAGANAIGGEGTFAGDVLGVKGASDEQLRQDIVKSDAEYEAARKATAPVGTSGERDPGFDALRLAGNVLSPANILPTRAAPKIVATAPVRTLAAKGAAAGAMGAAMQPVAGEDFALGKGAQVAAGAVGGAVLTPAIAKAGEAAARALQRYRSVGTVNVTPEGLRRQIIDQLRADGVEVDTIPDAVFQRLTTDVRGALASGRELDPAAALRQMDFQDLGLPALRGQVTRDPGQWTREFNLAGVENVGEPIANTFAQQSRGIAGRLDAAAGNADDAFTAGSRLVDMARTAQQVREGNVRAAYDAFRQSTGRDLEVPLQGLSNDYRATLREFGDVIPSAVRSRFDEILAPKAPHGHGAPKAPPRQIIDEAGKVLVNLDQPKPKGLTIEDAERLIKTLNRHTNPADKPAYRALGELRSAVQNAITGAADNASSGDAAMAAQLAHEARGMAADNFRNLAATPGLRAAVEGVEPDKFVQRYVLGGNVNEIERLAQAVGPEGRQVMAQQLVDHLRAKAFGANAAGDGKMAQAAFNMELRRIGRPKLVALLGQDGADEMFRIGRVLAYIKQAPEGATPNTSGTGQMLTSMLGKARGLKGLPYVSDYLVQPLAKFGDRQEVARALQGAPQQPTQLDPRTVEALAALFAPVPVVGGAALGYSGR